MKKISLLILLTITLLNVNAQKQANYWYFGENAGVTFSLGPPTPLTNGALDTGEGCSSISTSAGALEFYTDGRFVYNKNHQQMPNGSGLLGHSSSTQSGIIVPKPGSSTEYYIFTVDAAENGLAAGLCYSKVDMTLDNGLGDVVTTEKNIQLVPFACEKVTAVGHADGQTFWVITKKWGNADFYAYRIDWDGVNLTPVISTTGPMLVGNIGQASKGYLKVSPDGTKIAAANNTDFSVGIYYFDNSTGQITHLVSDDNYNSPGGMDPGGPYGVEFSPNSKILYISEWKANRAIHQYDLTSNDPETILNSRQVVASVGQSARPIGALQLGPDNRLYIARDGANYLSRINTPNNLGTFCSFTDNAVNLAGRNSRWGLPPFIQSFFFMSADFYWDEPACTGYTTNFYTSASETPDSVRWTFPGGIVSTELNPSFHFTTAGLFGVNLKVYIYGFEKNVSHFVRVGTTPQLELGNDSTICASEAFLLDAGLYTTYHWQSGDTTQTFLADTTGWYWCTITNESGCPATDSLYMTVNANPAPDGGPVQTIPEGTTATLYGTVSGGSGNYSYHWEPAAMFSNPNVLQPTTLPMIITTIFTLTVTDNVTGCSGQDTVLLNVTGGPLGCIISADETTICRGDQTQLHVLGYGGEGIYTYSWTSVPPGFTSDITEPTVQPSVTTTYHVEVYDGINTVSKQITINVNPLPVPDAGPNQSIPHGTPAILHGSSTGTGPYSFHWEPANLVTNPNAQDVSTVNLTESTVFSLTVTDLGTGCVSESPDFVTITIDGSALSANPYALPSVVCAGQQVQLFSLAGGGTSNYTYSWSSNPSGFSSILSEPTVSPTQTTTYTVTVNDGYNNASGNVTVTVNPLPVIKLVPENDPRVQKISDNEIGVCVFDSVALDAGNPGCSYLWSNGATDQTITIQTSGISYDLQEYSVTVNNPESGCSNSAEITAYFTFSNCSYGIEENDGEDYMNVYPNPSSDGSFTLVFKGARGKTSMELYSAQGRLIYKQTAYPDGTTGYESILQVPESKPGIYFLRISNDDRVLLKKLVIRSN